MGGGILKWNTPDNFCTIHLNEKRRSNEWYSRANKMCEHNAYNIFNQSKTYTWKDVFDES